MQVNATPILRRFFLLGDLALDRYIRVNVSYDGVGDWCSADGKDGYCCRSLGINNLEHPLSNGKA